MKVRELSSASLESSEEVPIGSQVEELYLYDGLSTPISHDVVVLSPKHVAQIARIAKDCIGNYGPSGKNGAPAPELTYVQSEFGVPTLLARVDCTVDSTTGDIVAYEMEDSPSGTGLTDRIHRAVGSCSLAPAIVDHYQRLLGQTPYVIVSGARNHGTDDSVLLGDKYSYRPGDLSIPPDLGDSQLVIVKAIPGQPESLEPYIGLQDRSVCTMASEGDKTYGERLGLYRCVASAEDLYQDGDKLRSQVVKRALGSMAMNIEIHLSGEDRSTFGKSGTVSASRLRRTTEGYIALDGYAYSQEFQPPVRALNQEGRKNLILRVYTLIEPATNGSGPTARVIGGCYVARHELIVHGASNAVTGAVVVE